MTMITKTMNLSIDLKEQNSYIFLNSSPIKDEYWESVHNETGINQYAAFFQGDHSAP